MVNWDLGMIKHVNAFHKRENRDWLHREEGEFERTFGKGERCEGWSGDGLAYWDGSIDCGRGSNGSG